MDLLKNEWNFAAWWAILYNNCEQNVGQLLCMIHAAIDLNAPMLSRTNFVVMFPVRRAITRHTFINVLKRCGLHRIAAEMITDVFADATRRKFVWTFQNRKCHRNSSIVFHRTVVLIRPARHILCDNECGPGTAKPRMLAGEGV